MNKKTREYLLPYLVILVLNGILILVMWWPIAHQDKGKKFNRKNDYVRVKRINAGEYGRYSNKDLTLVQPIFLIGYKNSNFEPVMESYAHPKYEINFKNIDEVTVRILPAGSKLFLTDEADERSGGDLFFKYKGEYVRFNQSRDEFFKELFDPDFKAEKYDSNWIEEISDFETDYNAISNANKSKLPIKLNKCILLKDRRFKRAQYNYSQTPAYLNTIAESNFKYFNEIIKVVKLDKRIKIYNFGYRINEGRPFMCMLVEIDNMNSLLALRRIVNL